MRKILVLLILFLALANITIAAEFSYYVRLNYNNSIITYQDLNVIEGKSSDFLNLPKEGYYGFILDFDDKELFSFRFDFPKIVYDLPGIFYLNETLEILTLPYFNNGQYIKIYNQKDKLELKIDLSSFALCNENFKCEPSKENHETCSLDCISGGNDSLSEYSMDGVCDPDCKEDFECKEQIIEEKIINELINKYENENEFYSQEAYYKKHNENITENIQKQITQREERIKNLKKPKTNYILILSLLLIILTILVAAIFVLIKYVFNKKIKKLRK